MPAGQPRRLVFLCIGLIAGLAGGLLGVGGGFLLVPLQVMWAGASQRVANATSVAALLPIGAVGAVTYYLGSPTPRVDPPLAALLAAGSVTGVLLGARLSLRVSERRLQLAVTAVLALAAAKQLLVPALTLAGGHLMASGPPAAVAAVITGLAVGTLTGSVAVGGAIVLVPTLVLVFGLEQHVAQGTSLTTVVATSLVGALAHARYGNVDLPAAAWMGAGGACSVVAGAVLALHLPTELLGRAFGLVLAHAAYRLWAQGREVRSGAGR